MKKVQLLVIILLIYGISFGQNNASNNLSPNNSPNNNAPLKIGDILPTNIHTTHPYNPTGVEGLVFEQTFYNKYSSYIKIYFKNFNLAPGDYVEITSPNTGESIIYAGQGKIIDHNGTMISDFWSQVLFDERIIVRLHSQVASTHYGFEIEEVAYGYPQSQIDQILQTKAICGQDDKEPIICYNGTTMYDKGRAVCRLLIGGSGLCTGWLLGCDGHVMTNNHCIGTVADALNTDFMFNYHFTNCNGTGNSTGSIVATSSTFIKTSANLDYTLVKLPVNPTSTYGYLSLSSATAAVNDRIYIVGHPGGRRKEITVNTDLNGNAGGFAIVNQLTGTGLRYMADTEGGSSGSPVIDYNTNLVVAIHNTGGCTNGSDGRSDQLITAIGVDMPNCGVDDTNGAPAPCTSTITSFPYVESFENTFGAWTQDTSDNFDWVTFSGATPTASTGPTTANDGNFYAYMESSAPNNPSKVAILNSPCFNLSSIAYPQLIFNYHLYGADMGNLKVEVSTNGATWTTLWTRTGDQGNAWIADTIDLNVYTAETQLRIRFNGTTGSSSASDIAIDAVSINSGSPTCNMISTFPYVESFENGFGAWEQENNDDFDWLILSGATPSNNTGPTAANDGTFYAYMEASVPNSPSKTAILTSPCFDLTSITNPELTFDYHLYGATTMGTLEVQVSVGGGAWLTLWTRTGNQGNLWKPAVVNLAPYTNATDLRIRFNGTTGADFQGDMAIDALFVGAAVFGCPSIVNTFPYNESFENTLGGWTQSQADEFDWTINSGTTPSNGTGPTTANDGTYYVFTESSSPNNPSKNAVIESPCFDLTGIVSPVVTFDYHMYGTDMGVLKLEGKTSTSNWTTIIARLGNFGDSWKSITLSLSAYANATDLKLRFSALTGAGFTSDMAVDAFNISSAIGTGLTTTVEELDFLTVAPNPFRDYVEILTNIEGILDYSISNIQGQVVQIGQINNNTILVNNLSAGVYFISFNNGKEQLTRKILKQY